MTGYIELFEVDGIATFFRDMRLLQDAKKFIIGLWLGTTAITLAISLHVGRCSMNTANAINKLISELKELVSSIFSLTDKVSGFMKDATEKNGEDFEKDVKKMLVEDTTRDQGDLESGVIELVAAEKSEQSSGSPELETALDGDLLERAPKRKKETGIIQIPSSSTKETSTQLSSFTTSATHPFGFFTKTLQKIFTSSILLVLGFLGYDIYIYLTHARRLSYDWFILFPFPFWFSLVFIINSFAFIITESVLYHRRKSRDFKRQVMSKVEILHCFARDVYKGFIDYIITLSATTLPVFITFHVFWLVIATAAFANRVASSITFYVPLAIFALWFLSVTSGVLVTYKKTLTRKDAGMTNRGCTCKRVVHVVLLLLRPLSPYLFLPFWVLLLATLRYFSDFLLNVVDLEKQSLLVIIGAIITIVIITVKIAKTCTPSVDDDDDDDND